MQAAPRSELAIDGRLPMVALVKQLMNQPHVSQISFRKGGLQFDLAGAGGRTPA